MIPRTDLEAMAARLAHALAAPRGSYRPLLIDRIAVGWLDDARATRLAVMPDTFVVQADGIAFAPNLVDASTRTDALDSVARTLATEGRLSAWRDERYAVAPQLGAEPWFLLERAAARYFGITTYAAHVSGVVHADGGDRMWLARRSATKAIDPGMLDNLVGGGIAAGHSVAATVRKESWEEAGIAAPRAATARPGGTVHICREQPDGLQRETIFVHDLWLPADFSPAGHDGEVAGHRLVTLPEAARLISIESGPDAVTADASLVILDFLFRHGEITPDDVGYLALDALRHPALDVAGRRDPDAEGRSLASPRA